MENTFFALGKLLRGERLQWWEWAKIIFVVTSRLVFVGSFNPLVRGLALHLFLDFSLQSGVTTGKKSSSNGRKRSRGWYLLVHAIVVGGWSGGVLGFWLSGYQGFLLGALIGTLSHFVIDYVDKFGIDDWRVGILVDQGLHLLSLWLIVILL